MKSRQQAAGVDINTNDKIIEPQKVYCEFRRLSKDLREWILVSMLASEFRPRSVYSDLNKADFLSMRFVLKQRDVTAISLTVPYQHFQRSRGYHYGFKYTEYMKLMTKRQYHDLAYYRSLESKERLSVRIKEYILGSQRGT